MILLSVLVLHIKSKTINHNCNSNYADFDKFENESYNYKISCSPQKTQKISLQNDIHIKTITILGKTKATIKCEQKLQNTSLYIFDKPILIFNDNCNFNTIEIFDSPTIILSQNKQINVEKLIFYNATYENIIHYKKIFSASSHKQIQNDNTFLCKTNLEFDISDDVHIKCSNSFELSINYTYFQYFQFVNYNNNPVILKNNSNNINFDYDLLKSILQSIFFYEKENILFKNFENITLLDPYIENFKSENSQLLTTFNWLEIMNFSVCPWIDGEYFDNNMKSFFDNIENQTYWRKICINNDGYLYYHKNQLKGVMYISDAKFFGIVALVIVVVILVIVSLYCIAKKLHFNKINLSINEDNLSDSKIDDNDE